jgi:hypothetical protein
MIMIRGSSTLQNCHTLEGEQSKSYRPLPNIFQLIIIKRGLVIIIPHVSRSDLVFPCLCDLKKIKPEIDHLQPKICIWAPFFFGGDVHPVLSYTVLLYPRIFTMIYYEYQSKKK